MHVVTNVYGSRVWRDYSTYSTLTKSVNANFTHRRLNKIEVVMKVSNKDKFQSEVDIVRNVYEGVKAMAEVEIEKEREGAPINYRLQMQYEMDDTEEINGALD